MLEVTQTPASTVLKLEDPAIGCVGGAGAECSLDSECRVCPNVCPKLLQIFFLFKPVCHGMNSGRLPVLTASQFESFCNHFGGPYGPNVFMVLLLSSLLKPEAPPVLS